MINRVGSSFLKCKIEFVLDFRIKTINFGSSLVNRTKSEVADVESKWPIAIKKSDQSQKLPE